MTIAALTAIQPSDVWTIDTDAECERLEQIIDQILGPSE